MLAKLFRAHNYSESSAHVSKAFHSLQLVKKFTLNCVHTLLKVHVRSSGALRGSVNFEFSEIMMTKIKVEK